MLMWKNAYIYKDAFQSDSWYSLFIILCCHHHRRRRRSCRFLFLSVVLLCRWLRSVYVSSLCAQCKMNFSVDGEDHELGGPQQISHLQFTNGENTAIRFYYIIWNIPTFSMFLFYVLRIRTLYILYAEIKIE